jgi:hypothetical protein
MADGSPESETPGTHGNSVHGNQEVPVALAAMRKRRAGRGTQKGTPFVNAAGKPDRCVIPEKAPNKRRKPAEGLEGRQISTWMHWSGN